MGSFPTNIQVTWSTLLAKTAYDNHFAPISATVFWPSEHNPDPLIQEELDKPSLLAPKPPPEQPNTAAPSQNGQHKQDIPKIIIAKY